MCWQALGVAWILEKHSPLKAVDPRCEPSFKGWLLQSGLVRCHFNWAAPWLVQLPFTVWLLIKCLYNPSWCRIKFCIIASALDLEAFLQGSEVKYWATLSANTKEAAALRWPKAQADLPVLFCSSLHSSFSLCSCLNWFHLSLLTWSACQCLTRSIPPAVFLRAFLSSVVNQLSNGAFSPLFLSKDLIDLSSWKGIVKQKVPREFYLHCIHFIKTWRAKYQRGRREAAHCIPPWRVLWGTSTLAEHKSLLLPSASPS